MELFDAKEYKRKTHEKWWLLLVFGLTVMSIMAAAFLVIECKVSLTPEKVVQKQIEMIDQRIKKFHQEMSWTELEVERMRERGINGIMPRERTGK